MYISLDHWLILAKTSLSGTTLTCCWPLNITLLCSRFITDILTRTRKKTFSVPIHKTVCIEIPKLQASKSNSRGHHRGFGGKVWLTVHLMIQTHMLQLSLNKTTKKRWSDQYPRSLNGIVGWFPKWKNERKMKRRRGRDLVTPHREVSSRVRAHPHLLACVCFGYHVLWDLCQCLCS